ncbi:MAG: Holliday junction resolvase RuvX [Phycisphaeraceae bacterium]|nr:Holliday junction resolvase RuvX [Phycisphaerales bacterium]MCB9860020.1 Holliday junction resolvase RuvX [Phycisphaeraceae bacterium]
MPAHDSSSPIIRYLAIDLGDKRTGLALGDSFSRLATPVGVLEVPISIHDGGALLDAIDGAIAENLGHNKANSVLVLGLPMNMDGSEGPRAKLVRAFAEKLAQRTGRTVELFDERLTSAEADWLMAQSGLSHKQKKQRRDAIAAAVMLKSYLDQQI